MTLLLGKSARTGPDLRTRFTDLNTFHGNLGTVSCPRRWSLRRLIRRFRLLEADVAGDLALDIAGMTFVDSTGLSLFIQLQKNLAARDRQLILFYPTSTARRLLMITGLDDVLRIEPGT